MTLRVCKRAVCHFSIIVPSGCPKDVHTFMMRAMLTSIDTFVAGAYNWFQGADEYYSIPYTWYWPTQLGSTRDIHIPDAMQSLHPTSFLVTTCPHNSQQYLLWRSQARKQNNRNFVRCTCERNRFRSLPNETNEYRKFSLKNDILNNEIFQFQRKYVQTNLHYAFYVN